MARAGTKLGLGLGLLFAAMPARAQPTWLQQAELAAPDALAGDQFGAAVALAGDTIFVGAPSEANGRRGAVYTFVATPGRWIQALVLTAANPAPNDAFGAAVAVDGTTAVVGAPARGGAGAGAAGVAHVYARTPGTARWALVQTLAPRDAEVLDRFGSSVAISGDLILVGAPGSSDPRGAAYVFGRYGPGPSWLQEAKLVTADAAAAFGTSVSLDRDTAIVGAPSPAPGAAYVFRRGSGTWPLEAKLPAPEAAAARFGASVIVSADLALSGAPGPRSDDPTKSSAYVFARSDNTWSLEATFVGPAFGSAVAIASVGGLVGVVDVGAFVYSPSVFGGWKLRAILSAADLTTGDGYAAALAANDTLAVVGAPMHVVAKGARGGRAYVFRYAYDLGANCSANSEQCASGFCVDGVCCDNACAGGASDCQACNVGGFGAPSFGRCSPMPADFVCRGAATACDQDSVCDGVNATCPADTVKPNGTSCGNGGTCSGGRCARPLDAGAEDAGSSDAGQGSPSVVAAGCGCGAVGVGAAPLGAGLLLLGAPLRWLRRRRR